MTKQTEKPKQVFCAIIVIFVFLFFHIQFLYNLQHLLLSFCLRLDFIRVTLTTKINIDV